VTSERQRANTQQITNHDVSRRFDGNSWLLLRMATAGLCLAASIPPWGWWPLSFIGIALLDRLLQVSSRRSRFKRMWLVAAFWLYPAMLWMWDLTPPGYLVAGALYSAYYGLAAALRPSNPTGRRLVLPGALAVAELARWYWPFGGVPLANLALSQVDTALGQTARVAGPLLVIVLVVVVGQALSAAIGGERRAALIAVSLVVIFIAASTVHPRATVVRDVETALIQGGGPTRTRASSDQQPIVLARHVETTRHLDQRVDLILWPENVVNPGTFLSRKVANETVAQVARDREATVLAGWFYSVSDTGTVNYQAAVTPDGVEVDRYDKVRIVPFGEYVPLRWLIESSGLSGAIPSRDVVPGKAEPVLDTPVGPVGVSISWEAFFERRSRDAVANGAQILTNPTNGSSFWLTQVHTQQVASNQLRAIENDRWLLMAAPTGISAVVDADGNLLQRTGIGERTILTATAEMRTGRTLASVVGPWPVLLYGLLALAAAQHARRSAPYHLSLKRVFLSRALRHNPPPNTSEVPTDA
jgi:apolipoprotein N-acyltransferase